ncbi:MAG: tetratricopeptide repeat protein [Bryobacterales bacterium]|nr:tetratricopeptide repeat protein [Bryobacterales bacterium]
MIPALSCVLLLLPLLLAAQPQPGQRQLFEQAAAALSRGDYARAEAGFQAVLQAQPGHIGALGNLGVTYARQERYAEAAATYQRALKLAPRDAALRLNLGLALLKQEKYAEALAPLAGLDSDQVRELRATAQVNTGAAADALQTLEPLPDSPGVLFLRGLARLKLGERDAAQAIFAHLEARLPESQAAYLRGKALYEAGDFDAAAAALQPCPTLDCRRELGKVYVSQRNAEGAEQAFRTVLAETPADREAAYFLGALLLERDQFPEGEALLRGPGAGFWAARYYLGKAALKQKRPAEALRHLEAVERERPGDPNLLYQLMRAYQSAGNPARAAQVSARLRTARARLRDGEQAALVLR